jgi:hypothetical protein
MIQDIMVAWGMQPFLPKMMEGNPLSAKRAFWK